MTTPTTPPTTPTTTPPTTPATSAPSTSRPASPLSIVVIGATGMVGRRILDESLRRGHRVTAVARRTDALDPRDGLVVHAANAADSDSLRPALEGADVVVLTVRAPAGQEGTLAPLTAGVLEAAALVGARAVIIGGAGALRSPDHPDRLLADDPAHVPAQWRALALAGIEQLEACRARPAQAWTYVSPSAVLDDGPGTGGYRRGTDILLTDEQGSSRISAADLALAVLDEIEEPGRQRHWTAIQA